MGLVLQQKKTQMNENFNKNFIPCHKKNYMITPPLYVEELYLLQAIEEEIKFNFNLISICKL